MTNNVPADSHKPSASRRRFPRSRAYRALALLPPLGLLIGVPIADHVHRYVLGLPFLLFWIVTCVVSTSIVMALIHALDKRRDVESGT